MALQEEFESQGNFLFRYRSKLPLVLLPAALGIYMYQEYFKANPHGWSLEEVYPYLCLAVAAIGIFIRAWTVGHTPANTSGRNTAEGQLAEKLNTSGLYATLRHPLYLGNFFMWLGVAMLTENAWFVLCFCLAYWIYYERIMYAEEQFLRRKFGDAYEHWASGTPAFLPDLRKYRKPTLPFSIKKVLKKEKNGVFAVFLLIFVFQYSEDVIHTTSLAIEWDFWTYAMLASGGIYFVLKFIKKYTALLNEAGR